MPASRPAATRTCAWWAVSLLGLLLGLVVLIGPSSPGRPVLITLIAGVGLIQVVATSRRQPAGARWRWALLGCGVGIFALADLGRALPARTIPAPAWFAGALLALGYCFLLGGLVRLGPPAPAPGPLPPLLDAVVLLIAAAMVTWAVVIAPILATPARAPAAQALRLVAAIGGLSLLGVLAPVLVQSGSARQGAALLAVGVGVALGDEAVAVRTAVVLGAPLPGALPGAAWILPLAVGAFAVWARRGGSAGPPATAGDTLLFRWQHLGALAVAALVGPILLVVYQDGRLNLNDWVMFVGSTLVSLLILLRLSHAGRQVRAYAGAAQQAAARKTQFLATMSHEVRTPLNAIIGYASVLLDPRAEPLTTEQRQDVQLILASSHRLLGLITELLDLARLDAARLPLTIAPVALAEVVAEALGEVAPQARAKGIDLLVEVPPALPPLPADGQRLRQVLVNLLGNAVKFTERGTVTVQAALVDEQLTLIVADTGVGIPADELPHIFDEYRQAATGLSRKQGGSGLGLAIAKRLVELHGGSIAVASVEGQGTTVTVRLPAGPPAPA